MKSIQQINQDARHVTYHAAIEELEREIKVRIGTEDKPGGAYTRWANAEPFAFTKHRQYEAQTARLIAVLKVLKTLEPENWNRRLLAATIETRELF